MFGSSLTQRDVLILTGLKVDRLSRFFQRNIKKYSLGGLLILQNILRMSTNLKGIRCFKMNWGIVVLMEIKNELTFVAGECGVLLYQRNRCCQTC